MKITVDILNYMTGSEEEQNSMLKKERTQQERKIKKEQRKIKKEQAHVMKLQDEMSDLADWIREAGGLNDPWLAVQNFTKGLRLYGEPIYVYRIIEYDKGTYYKISTRIRNYSDRSYYIFTDESSMAYKTSLHIGNVTTLEEAERVIKKLEELTESYLNYSVKDLLICWSFCHKMSNENRV